MSEPRFYAACLASYNAGRLHGVWIDVSTDLDAMNEAVQEMLRASPCPNVTRQIYRDEDGAARYVDVHSAARPGTIPEDWTKEGEPFASAEEWAVHDFDGMPNLGEYPGLAAIVEFAALLEEHHHIDAADLVAIVGNWRDVDEAAQELKDNFVGIFDTFHNYADEAADEMLACHDIKDDNPVARYFDYEAWARDLRHDMTVVDVPSGVAVFHQ